MAYIFSILLAKSSIVISWRSICIGRQYGDELNLYLVGLPVCLSDCMTRSCLDGQKTTLHKAPKNVLIILNNLDITVHFMRKKTPKKYVLRFWLLKTVWECLAWLSGWATLPHCLLPPFYDFLLLIPSFLSLSFSLCINMEIIIWAVPQFAGYLCGYIVDGGKERKGDWRSIKQIEKKKS